VDRQQASASGEDAGVAIDVASNYAAIKQENLVRYGTDIARIGQELLANRYDDRTHFIYELLQNAEDALSKRDGWAGSRAIVFELESRELLVSHYGVPFSDSDVRGICGIGESTKGLTSIGRFGIGFKSVYAFTDSPEVHSGDEHFAIESFVWPRAVPARDSDPDQTVLRLPLRDDDEVAVEEISIGLRRLGMRVLLFLREINEIQWHLPDGSSGIYLRSDPKTLNPAGHRITLVGERSDAADTEEEWLVFDRIVKRGQASVGYVEVAFLLDQAPGDGRKEGIAKSADTELVVFFPTVVATNLGFLVQGPYRTTPSRDNVPKHDPWNEYLVRQTSELLVDSLGAVREMGLLDADAIRTLPLDPSRFAEGSMFAALYQALLSGFKAEPLLPRVGGGHVTAGHARLARTRELRDLFSSDQLATLGSPVSEAHWLSDEITQDRAPELRTYLMRDLAIPEYTWDAIIPRLTRQFLETQPDEWIGRLYEVLGGQPALLQAGRLETVPLIRLTDGMHCVATRDEEPQAFLPGPVATSFPTVSTAVLTSPEARTFLERLGLTEPDPVDDVIRNVLPTYAEDLAEAPPSYADDVARMLRAFATDSKSRRDALVTALEDSAFVAVVDYGTGSRRLAKPGNVYVATQRLKDVFQGVAGILLVDDTIACLRGEDVRELLEAAGASRYLATVRVRNTFSDEERAAIRRNAGWERSSGGDTMEDFSLRGLDGVLGVISSLAAESAADRARALWQALGDLDQRRGAAAFSGTYRWWYRDQHSADFDAHFVRRLNTATWVPEPDGGLRRPGEVPFDAIAPPWPSYPNLLTRIRFRPPAIEMLARETGLEPGLLDLLKRLGLTSEAELRSRLKLGAGEGKPDEAVEREEQGDEEEDGGDRRAAAESGQASPVTAGATADEDRGQLVPRADGTSSADGSAGSSAVHGQGDESARSGVANGVSASDASRRAGQQHRVFISYVAVHREDESDEDPDGLDHEERLRLEEAAIGRILEEEPQLSRTPTNNPGFDLVELNAAGRTMRYVEVKAMTGKLTDRPVGLSHTQFVAAQEFGDQYWLYVVEEAGIDGAARILRIRDPAGSTRTFTFDHGWTAVAESLESTT
jgi:hypothetical protein